ncbi:hypothetical protein LTR97_001383 [Elasticomyces elasticus]|uniref:BIR-domain-containing protein n=1 Tax=Elasticomyces elasticus TaxID=574655 RepID=A0AAN7VWY7_9PEZI|nr:hypothetical protein LTR97_001383 [Elasticomyces elasticus]
MAAAAAATGPTPLMRTAAARLATFQHPQPTDLRRASSTSNRKKAANVQTATWPHESPSIEDLAKAGFFYLPLPHNPDNTKCFSCAVKLDGWEASDNPLAEHLAHAPTCPWALCKSVALPLDNDDEPIDPMSEAMVTARTSTFVDWPHEGKRGWRCKVSKMAEAGWCHDPSPEDEDGVTCFYCDVSLDGWEPKDDPWVEHERRTPGCRFFVLSKLHGHVHGSQTAAKKGKAGKVGGRSRAGSTASRVEADGDLEEEGVEAGEDSVLSNATTASQATVKGAASKKKGGRAPKAAAKGRKRAATIEQEPEPELEPEPEQEQEQEPMAIVQTRKSQVPGTFPESSILDLEPETETAEQQREEEATPPPPPAKATRATRKGTRQSKQAVDSSILEVSQMDVVPTKKATRGRKAKAPVVREPTPEPEPEMELKLEAPVTPEVDGRASDVSAQLQEELDHSILVDSQSQHEEEEEEMVMEPEEESTPQPAGRGKRGTKRTSEGVVKVGESSVLGMEFPEAPAVSLALPKGKGKGRKGSKQIAPAAAAPVVSVEREVEEEVVEEVEMQDVEGGQEKDEESGNWEVFAAASEEPEAQAPPAYEERTERETSPPAEEVVEGEDEMTPGPARPSKKARVGGKGKKAPASKKAKAAGTRKASSTTRSSRTKKAESVEPEAHGFEEGVEDLDRDEREIEEEIARMGEEERSRQQDLDGGRRMSRVSPAVIIVREDEQDRVEEYEDSPIHHRSERRDEEVMDEVHDVPDENVTLSPVVRKLATATPSPNGSDKENLPSTSSLARPMTALKAPVQAPQFLSPTKTTRIPLAPGTPNRLLSSPRRQNQNIASPTKTSLRLESTMEWAPVDLDTVFLASPQAATPGTMLTRLVEVGGGLNEVERGMSVEEWVRWRAGKGEEELRRRCEGAVSLFEREGGRGVEVLEGVVVG